MDRARVAEALGAMTSYLLAKSGWFLLLVGLIPGGMGLLDELTCRRAEATIERVAAPRVLISFATPEGRRIRIWASASKLGLRAETVTAGSRTRLLYRGEANGHPYVAETFSSFHALLGLAMSTVGALLLAIRRRLFKLATGALRGEGAPPAAPSPSSAGLAQSRPRTVERRVRSWG